jgi:hypothetical protein
MDLYYPTANAFNAQTGGITRAYNVININKVLILPTDLLRDFEYDIAFLAANKNFTFGGFFDKDKVVVAVKHRDLMGHIPVELEDHMIYLNKKWQVKKVQEYADLQCFVIEMQALVGIQYTQIFNLMSDTLLTFTGAGTP